MIFDFLFGVVQSAARRISMEVIILIQGLLRLIQAVLFFLADAINRLADLLAPAIRRVFRAAKWLWTEIMQPVMIAVRDFARRIHDIIARVLRPLLETLSRINRLLSEFYLKYVFPVMQVLQRIRQVFFFLRLFHLKFAQQLDKLFFALELKIWQSFRAVQIRVNSNATLLNALLTKDLILQPRVLLGSIAGRAGAVWATLINIGLPGDVEISWRLSNAAVQVTSPAEAVESFRTGEIFRSERQLKALELFRSRVSRSE